MTTGQLIDLLLRHHFNAGSNDVNISSLRDRALELSQEVVEEFWDENDWDFKQATATDSLTAATDAVDAPANFVSFGEAGGLYITIGGQSEKLTYVTPAVLFAKREYNRNSGSGVPQFYTVSQIDSTYRVQVIFDCIADTTYSVRFYYDTHAPRLLDKPSAPTVALGSGAGGPDGDYRYIVTFVSTDGTESEAGTPSALISVDSGISIIELTNIPVGNDNTVQRIIYRPVGDGTDYFHLIDLDDNTTTTLTDNFPDGALTYAMTASSTSSNFSKIPEMYQRSVVLKGCLSRLAATYGDGRQGEYEAAYRRELGRAKARRRHGLEDLQRIGGLGHFGMH